MKTRFNHEWAALLAFAVFFGIVGVHRMYAGKFATAILMMFTLGGFFIVWFVDIFMILIGAFRDDQGRFYRPFIPA